MKKIGNWRPNLILGFVILFGAAIISRLFFLQILEHKHFQAQALGQQVGFLSMVGSRGQIFCENSQGSKGSFGSTEVKSLAINKDSWTVSADVSEIEDKEVFAKEMGGVLDIKEEEVSLAISSENSYAVIKNNLSSENLDKVKQLDVSGIYWSNDLKRYYPQEKFLSKVLGFLGGEGQGQYGIEGYYEEILKGKAGIKEEKRGLDSLFGNDDFISLDGSDIYLTIDYNIQFQAEALLQKAKENLDIDSGQIIVMKPESGKILALADFPNFNPNEYSKEKSLEVFQNAVTQKLFEPGSIFKPVTMAAALNEDKITPETTFNDTGFVKFGTKVIRNFANEVYDNPTMTEVLEESINTGVVFAQQQLGNKKFFEYVEKFGLTKKTEIDLQGEVYSRNEGLKSGPDMNFATASFGQGIEITPIQMLKAYTALINKGRLAKPYIVAKIVSGDDEMETQPELSEPIISETTASEINSMLISVVDNGFHGAAKIEGYFIGGKTGTAQVPLKNSKGYDENKTIQSFVGYGPALDPEFLILIKLDDPKVAKSSLSAVPVFKELAQYIINYWKIPPDYEPAQ